MTRKTRTVYACVIQNDPSTRTKRENLERASAILEDALANPSRAREHAVGVVVAPEMFAHRYQLTLEQAHEVAEDGLGEREGECVWWAKKWARELNAAVAVGYVQRAGEKLYDAQGVATADGDVRTYKKTHLYDMDDAWASESDEGFKTMTIEVGTIDDEHAAGRGTITASPAICMDINPRRFEAPWDAYELANATLAAKSDLILFSSAWTNAHPLDALETKRKDVDAEEVLNYWFSRLAPLANTNTYFVCANRIGEENDIKYCGCSCVIDMRAQRVVAHIDPGMEGALLVPLELDVDVADSDDDDHHDDHHTLRRRDFAP